MSEPPLVSSDDPHVAHKVSKSERHVTHSAPPINPILLHHHPKSSVKEHQRDSEATDPDYVRPSLHHLVTREFYQKEGWFEGLCEALFKIKYRKTTIKAEVYHGVIHFISCLYCLAVVPQQLSAAGYDSNNVVVAVALLCGVGSISCGLIANLPFVIAPPTVVTIFLSVYLQQHNIGSRVGNYGVIISGFLMMFFFWRPLGDFVKHLIPVPIQVGTVVGIGLLTTLAGSTEIDLVIAGEYKILRMGHITAEIIITFTGVIIICVAMRYHIKGSFCIAVVFCSVVWWLYDGSFPNQYVAAPTVTTAYFAKNNQEDLPLLTIDLLFLYILYLNGLLTSLSNLAVLTRGDNTIPRGRWIFIISGFFTVCGGLLTTAPLLVSPESAAAIKEGAKTGLSTVVCGALFLVASFFSPLFKRIPPSGTSPVLIMIGLVLFQNVNRIDWRKVADAAPAFVVLFYIPFTYSIIQGVILGYVMYLSITLCTGELLENALYMYLSYCPGQEDKLMSIPWLRPYIIGGDGGYGPAAADDAEDDGKDGDASAPGTPLRRVSVATPTAAEDRAGLGIGESDFSTTAKRRASRASMDGATRSIDMDLHLVGMDSIDGGSAKERRKSRAISVAPDFSTTFDFASPGSPGADNALDGGGTGGGSSGGGTTQTGGFMIV